ncbi:MAG: hypothetical protein ABFD92_12390 [Planctomycetaceae bacterium]|nr:hypothetical protein [Planctomycetaceae bacterium]
MPMSDSLSMLINFIPLMLHWLVYAAIIVGVIVGMKRQHHWSFILMLCGMALLLVTSVGGAVVCQYLIARHGPEGLRIYVIISKITWILSALSHAAFAVGFIVRMATLKRLNVPTVQPAAGVAADMPSRFPVP